MESCSPVFVSRRVLLVLVADQRGVEARAHARLHSHHVMRVDLRISALGAANPSTVVHTECITRPVGQRETFTYGVEQ